MPDTTPSPSDLQVWFGAEEDLPVRLALGGRTTVLYAKGYITWFWFANR